MVWPLFHSVFHDKNHTKRNETNKQTKNVASENVIHHELPDEKK